MNNLKADINRYYELAGQKVPCSIIKLLLSCLHPRIMPVALLRTSDFFYSMKLGLIAKIFSILNVTLFGIEVSPKVKIGGGLFLPHTVGTVIGADVIGSNVTIMQGVTIGAKELDITYIASSRPIIGNNVLIGAGAKIIGRINIGDFAKIGANAVVIDDIPAHSVAVGIPARVVRNNKAIHGSRG
jgi:serine O-acetyltransferase